MKKYLVSVKINESIEYEAETEQEAIDNMKDWLEKNIERAEFTVEEID